MSFRFFFLFSTLLFIAGCTSTPSHEETEAKLEKWPKCYSANVKIFNKCVDKNEAGIPTSALDMENTAVPGQHR